MAKTFEQRNRLSEEVTETPCCNDCGTTLENGKCTNDRCGARIELEEGADF